MKPFRIDRRTVLRGAGSVAIALPWLEAMAPIKESRAAEGAAKRFVAVYWPGGTVSENYGLAGTSTEFTLGPILQPLELMRHQLVFFKGLDLKCANGDQHASGMVAWLAGCAQDQGLGVTPPNSSLDLVLAERLGVPLLSQAVRWSTRGLHSGVGQDREIVTFRAEKGGFERIQPEIDPVATWQRLFGTPEPAGDLAWRQSILDSVLGRYARLAAKLGSRDRQTLEAHMAHLREVEQGLTEICVKPEVPDLTGYDPLARDQADPVTDAAIPKVGKLMMDMLVAALACDLTRAATMQWVDANAHYTLPWLNLNETQECYENNCGYQVPEMTKIFTWYSQQHAYLLGQMERVEMGDGKTLLDDSVVFFGTQLRSPPDHLKDNMPFLLGGGGGGLLTNRLRDYAGRSHNDLLVAILNLFGDDRTSFGDPQFNTGALSDLRL